ncbi:leucine-rich repeat-containing G-protein coupled receptor 5 [Bacillus rossius redtenbacheri]|uniref:leucine-rich repeat-containing G-protein coupled receptor 5 n=1 Tax=Bacillus rossius redtenbacheri TaxID=93214 RepID=UPI002FDEF112
MPVRGRAVSAVLVCWWWVCGAGARALCPEEDTHPLAAGCQCSREGAELACRGAGLLAVPARLPASLVKLDLANNNITEINEDSFRDLPLLEELILAKNRLVAVHPEAFARNRLLKRLSLQNCGLRDLPWGALQSLAQLTSLQLDQNEIQTLPAEAFSHVARLRNLRLDGNQLTAVPSEALRPLGALEALNLGNNQLTSIPVGAFPEMPNLVILLLKGNSIASIDDEAFANLTSLRALELDMNLLTSLPAALTSLTALKELSVSGNRIRSIPAGVLQRFPGLVLLELRGNPLAAVEPRAFAGLPRLKKLILSDARELEDFPNLNGTYSLELLRLDRSSISHVPASLCRSCPRLKTLDLKLNKLTHIPDLTSCKELRVLDLTSNHISDLHGQPFHSLALLHDLLLAHNAITELPGDAFRGLQRLQVLDLEANAIQVVHPEVFLPFAQLEDLNLGNNLFPSLPPAGLDRLLHVKTFNNPNLREFPPPESFPRIQSLVLSYAYHCCAFLPLIPAEPPPRQALHETVFFPTDNEFDLSLWNSSGLADIWPQLQNLSSKFGTQINELWDNFGSDFTYPGNMPSYVEEYFEEQDSSRSLASDLPPSRIKCLPLPGPFLPCQDLFDWWTLRCGVWIVFLLAMLGNGTVVFVLIFSRSKMDVPRFLVCNLAAADFFMGVYLGFLAVVDASTLGEFRMYAIPWQMSAGCQLAGFLGVLSSELSVYTLAVITLERNYAITHAMHLNKRLSLKHAGYIMACGWGFSVVMAVLPLLGVSEYRKFAVCLPFETTTGPASLAYVVFLMFVNGVAFLILMGCYLKMYCAIRGSQAWNSNDSRIAKRMALLVFTDFICWSPIAFFSLTAAFGLQLVSLEQAKVFTVFVLPLNSCCNPFLYAILTKQFKKDCVLICKAIEESRVTRGIGRCRHSSNFSNRQTPANTNSLVDRSSRENQAQCACGAKLLPGDGPMAEPRARTDPRRWLAAKARRLLLPCRDGAREPRHRGRSDQYAYQIAEIQQKQHKRASSVSSSENFSSSRSDSWRQGHHHRCGIPLRLLEPKRRASSWLVARKTSQDSNLSSSRNDSSGSATTASTGTWRMSRSSASSGVAVGAAETLPRARAKPRLIRQAAIQDDAPDPPGSPSRLTVRFLTTIPSAAETSVQLDEEAGSHTAVLHASPLRDGAVVLHHEASAGQHDPDNT